MFPDRSTKLGEGGAKLEDHLEEESGEGGQRQLVVEETAEGTRLDTWLATQILTTSRTQLRRAIESGRVMIEGRVEDKPARPVHAGEKILVEVIPMAPLVAKPSPIPLEILYEDEAILVVHKPAGMVTHPGAGVLEGTLANGLVYYFQQQQQTLPRRGGPSRPGIVHRLDVGTSGVLVVARTDEAHLALAEQFQSRRVRKEYQALVHGRVEVESGRIEAAIGRDPRSRVRMSVRRAGEGREALTLYRVVERWADFTRLDIEIKTGRTHQIRVHLAHLHHPIAGDTLYDGGRANTLRSPKIRAALTRLGRPFLHAARLGFFHPLSGAWQEFSAPLPADLEAFLTQLREPSQPPA
jgi:23S rRNA pseudouridine1911/1915/1917 synthase